MSVKRIAHPHALSLPQSFRRKLYNDKITDIILAIFTCGISLGVQATVRHLKVKWLNKFFLPAAFKDYSHIEDIEDERAIDPNIVNNHGHKLDAKEIEINSSSKKWLVYFCGNDSIYQKLQSELTEYAEAVGVNLLLVNYRGVSKSEGCPVGVNHLLIDGAACTEYLMQKKRVAEEDIVLWGFSLGGAVAVLLARYYTKIKVFNEMSFGDSIKTIYYLWDKGITGCLGVMIVILTGSAIRVGKYWSKISDDRKMMVYHPLDGIVHRVASLYQDAKRRLRAKPNCIKIRDHRFYHIPIDSPDQPKKPIVHREYHYPMNPCVREEVIVGLKALFGEAL